MNENIINNFKLLIKQIQFDIDSTKGKEQITNLFRLRSITNVLKILEKFTEKIISSDQLKNIKGIGSHSLKRIDEILKTGKLSEINPEIENKKYLEYVEKLEDIYGIGRKTALELFKKHNIKTIEELKNIKNLPENVKKGLKYYDKIKFKIPRSEMDEIENFLVTTLYEIDINLFGVVCGSYRRLLPTSNDIDFFIVHPKIKTKKDMKNKKYLKTFIEKLRIKNFIIDSFTSDDVITKFMGICKWNNTLRRIDIRYIPYESYYFALLYFTGNGEFNRKMRQLAIIQDYLLNEYGIYKNKKMIHVKSEKEIFDILKMEYISPDKRNF